MKNLDEYINEATSNIRDDRAMASKLLIELVGELSKDKTKHERNGAIAAKYLETLQRSNEQLVKIAGLVHKNSNASTELSLKDREDIFDILKDSKKEEGNV